MATTTLTWINAADELPFPDEQVVTDVGYPRAYSAEYGEWIEHEGYGGYATCDPQPTQWARVVLPDGTIYREDLYGYMLDEHGQRLPY